MENKISAGNLCNCTHFKTEHFIKQLYSKASKSFHFDNVCHHLRCRCKHFEKTTFIPESNYFNQNEEYINNQIYIQGDFFNGK